MNFADVAVAFSQEEWGLLDEAQRLLHCDVMREIFALVTSVGKTFTSLLMSSGDVLPSLFSPEVVLSLPQPDHGLC